MSKSPIRNDKTCLNCRYVVENKFCPNCGQENIDTRKTFLQLFVHFFEDLTHYENSFWKTIKNLIFKPASLTIEYLSGKRMSYLAPIRLYIFISFVTFFVISIFPENENDDIVKVKESTVYENELDSLNTKKDSIVTTNFIKGLEKNGLIDKEDVDSLQKEMEISRKKNRNKERIVNIGHASIEEMDSIQKFAKEEDKLGDFYYRLNKKFILAQEGKTQKEVKDKFTEAFFKNIPKALFIYMPLFAFVLWLFQDKKRWYYFDHGIFTLHYFSFLLLAFLIIELYSFFFNLAGNNVIFQSITGILDFIVLVYILYYFFPAHHRFYGQSRLITIIKGSIIFVINMIILGIILTGIAAYSFINIH
ncbi:DUF3667 domain-containing protein [Flavobacterium sp. j3]|uniref:DUF3667 domain-containing protein n=1 Tax=Flavobacterium aureirubrum TaxID=3133147 RepID=A0ABU9N733_9FLAO